MGTRNWQTEPGRLTVAATSAHMGPSLLRLQGAELVGAVGPTACFLPHPIAREHPEKDRSRVS